MEMPLTNAIPIACDLTALAAEVRSTHIEAARQLLHAGAREVQELPDGFAFRYAAEQFAQVTQFIANERLCCPFFTFVLKVTPANGPIWLRITGREGGKDFLRSELGKCDG
jgi:hypothetical protein